MFNGISWHSYWKGLAMITVLYYIVIYLLYFRKDAALFFLHSASSPSDAGIAIPAGEPSLDAMLEEEQDRAEAHTVYACIDEIKALFAQLQSSKGVKSEILYALQQLLAKYPALKNSGYQKAIATVIISQCEHICAIRLSKEELDGVWLR